MTRLLLAASLAAAAAFPAAAVQTPTPLPVTTVTVTAATSQLPYPASADLWVDAGGKPAAGAVRGISSLGVVLFRPSGDLMSWPAVQGLYQSAKLLQMGAAPLFRAVTHPESEAAAADPDANSEETRVFRGAAPRTVMVLGTIRNLASQHLLVYAVRLSGEIAPVEAVKQARSLVTELGLQAKLKRFGPPRPAGAVADAPELRLRGPQITQLLVTIRESRFASDRIKKMAAAILPRATSVTLTRWRTPDALSDAAFFRFYEEQAERLGWGAPVVRDETIATRPSMIFQLPGASGVAMIRAQPVEPALGVPLAKIIHVLMIDGAIDTSRLDVR